MTAERHITWENLARLIGRGTPERLAIPGQPALSLFVEPGGRGLWLLVPWEDGHGGIRSGLEAIATRDIEIDGQRYLSVGTTLRRLFQECHAVLTAIADDIQLAKKSVLEAIRERVGAWRELLQQIAVLSREEEVGLLGELWFVRRATARYGLQAFDGWLGPKGEAHDFTGPDFSVEVKTTTSRERIHVVSDLRQLVAPPARPLFVLSLQLQPVGGSMGRSLPDAIRAISAMLAHDSSRAEAFGTCLAELGYSVAHDEYYQTRFGMRTVPVLVPVDARFPALSPDVIDRSLGPGLASRISRVTYCVNLEGMGTGDGTAEFLAVLPTGPAGDLL